MKIDKEKCETCVERYRCRDSSLSWVFFIIGLIATIAMRVVTVLMHIKPVYGQIAWYVGVGGFFLFFLYKFKIDQERAKIIEEQDILGKIDGHKQLEANDYALIRGLLCSLISKKERINYFFIFGLSAVAWIVALYVDFLR